MIKRHGLGILLLMVALLGLLYFVLEAYRAVRPSYFSLSPDGRYLAETSPAIASLWGRGGDFYHTRVTDLETGTAHGFWVRGADRRRWSGGENPNLALETWALLKPGVYSRSLTVFSTRDASLTRLALPGAEWARTSWSPDGRFLVVVAHETRKKFDLYGWASGAGGLERIPAASDQTSWGGQHSLLVREGAAGGLSRFSLIDLDRPETPTDVTDRFPPLAGIEDVAQVPLAPGLFLMVFSLPGSHGAVVWDYEQSREVGRWAGGRSYALSDDGRWLYEEIEDRKGKQTEFRRVDLRSLSEESLWKEPAGSKRWFGLMRHPEGKWNGIIREGATTGLLNTGRQALSVQSLGPSSWTALLTPMLLGGQSDDRLQVGAWYGPRGQKRIGFFRDDSFFPSPALFEPISGQREDLPIHRNWPALFKAGMWAFWVSLAAFLGNMTLFALLFWRSASPGARPLGLFFWALAWPALPYGNPVQVISYWWTGSVSALYITFGGYLLASFGIFCLPAAAARFATRFPEPNTFSERFPRMTAWAQGITAVLPAIPLVGAALLAVALGDVIPSAGESDSTASEALGIAGMAIGAMVFLGFLIFILALVAVVHNFRFAGSPKVRSQLKYVAFGFAADLAWGVAVGPLFLGLADVLTGEVGFIWPCLYLWGVLLIPGLSCGYALLSSELLDLSFVVRRTVKYAALVAILGLLFVGIVAGLGVLLPSVLGTQSPVSVALASVVTVLAFQPVRRKVQDWVDRRFDRARYDARRTLSDLTARFATMGSTEQIRATLESAARDVLRVSRCCTLFFREGKIPRGRTGVSALQEDAAEGARPGQPADLKDIDLKDLRDALAVEEPWIRLVVPVAHGNEAYAVLALGEKLSQEKYSAEDREFLRILTDGAGLALKNLSLVREAAKAEVFQRDLEEARSVQLRQLPRRIPVIPGFEVAASTQAARIVGGDYYDVIALPGDKFALLIADVSGKGMPAALRMADVRSHMHALLRRVPSPAEVLQETNLYLCAQESRNEFTTMLLGILDPASATLRLSSAGHLPPLLAEKQAGVRTLAVPPALPLGADPSEVYVETEVALPAGSALFLMSDGLPERMDGKGELFGFEGVEDAIRSLDFEGPAEALLAGLLARADAFAEGADAEDDQTVIVVRALGAAR